MAKIAPLHLAVWAILSAPLAAAANAVSAEGAVTLVAIGDTLLGGAYENSIAKGVSPLRNLAPLLTSADLALANLEGPMTRRGTRQQGKKFTFRIPPSRARLFREAGVDVVAMANNHILDFGAVGLADTIAALDGESLRHCGAGSSLEEARRPAILEAGGLRVAFLSYNRTWPSKFWAGKRRPGTAFADESYIRADVTEAKKEADAVVVVVHWGQEKSVALREYQVSVAKACAEAGAALVIGGHPHIAQGIGRIGDTLVAYSLGDGVFGGANKRTVGSLVLRAVIGRTGVGSAEFLPLDASNVDTEYAPRIMTGAPARATLETVKGLSELLGTGLSYAVTAEGHPCLKLDMVSATVSR